MRSDDEDEEEEEEEGDDEKQVIKKEDAQESHECDTLDIASTVKQLSEKIKEESFLLVNSTNWEENIIFDLSQANLNEATNGGHVTSRTFPSVNMNSTELINERIKYAGWIPSSEHRTLSSFQSKILGKKVDFINNYKDQAVPNLSGTASAKSSAHAAAQAVAANSWNSIFPNQNYDLLHGNWEARIIIDTETLDVSKISPPDFCLDLNDDNLLLGLPDDMHSLDELRHKEDGGGENAGAKRGEKVKVYENRAKMSKNLLGKSGKEAEHLDENQNDVRNYFIVRFRVSSVNEIIHCLVLALQKDI